MSKVRVKNLSEKEKEEIKMFLTYMLHRKNQFLVAPSITKTETESIEIEIRVRRKDEQK